MKQSRSGENADHRGGRGGREGDADEGEAIFIGDGDEAKTRRRVGGVRIGYGRVSDAFEVKVLGVQILSHFDGHLENFNMFNVFLSKRRLSCSSQLR